MTRQQLFDFFTKNPGLDIVDEDGVHHHYMFWLKHRLDFLANQEEHWRRESQERIDLSIVGRHYAEQELQRTRREIRRLLNQHALTGVVTVPRSTPGSPLVPRENPIETAWRLIKNVWTGGNR